MFSYLYNFIFRDADTANALNVGDRYIAHDLVSNIANRSAPTPCQMD